MSGVVKVDLPPIPDDIVALTAPLLFGTIFNWALFGVLTIQVYIYNLNFSEDKRLIKVLVYSTYALEVFQTALSAANLYHWFGEGYGNMTYLDETYLSPLDTPALCGIMAAIVQMFYAFRIVSLRKSLRWVAGWICLTSATQTVAALISAVKAYQKSHFSLFHNDYPITVAFLIWNIAGFVSDVTIAIAMLYIFRASRLRVDQSTATILSRVVRVILETNALTATIAMVSLIMFVLFPTKSYFICSTFVMGKLYSNTLLVTFNNRLALRRIPDSIGFGLSTSNAVSQSFYFSTIMDIDRDEFAASGHHLSRVSHATQSESSKSRTYEGGKPALQSENSTYSIGRDIDRAEYAQDGSSLGTSWSKGFTTGGESGEKVLEDEVSRRTKINSSPC